MSNSHLQNMRPLGQMDPIDPADPVCADPPYSSQTSVYPKLSVASFM